MIKRRPIKRRILFNCDGNSVFINAGGDLNQWIRNVFCGLEHSHVEALLWCDGAGGNTANYDSQVLELTGRRLGKVDPFLKRLIDEGNDPPKVVVREAKKRGLDVFYSFRINDVHDVQAGCVQEYATFKDKHPEWQIGQGHPYGQPTSLNFAVPEVRALKFAVIQELFEKHDFDGLEIDFLRSPPFFIPGTEPENAGILTDFLREVREHLDQRGRPIELAARVDETLEACRLDGFDVATWMKEGLVDVLILGSGVMDMEVEAFKRLAQGTAVLIYPCLYGWPSKYMPISVEMARGLAANYWYQGADGLYLFNWFPNEPDKAYQISLLKEIGDPNALRGKPMMFAADRRPRPMREYPHNWMHCVLPAQLSEGKAVHVPILVGDDLSAASPSRLELRLACANLAADRLGFAFNGQPLAEQKRSPTLITVSLTPSQVRLGKNVLTVTLVSRAPQAQGALTLEAAEIHAGHG